MNSRAVDAYLAHRYVPAPLAVLEGVHKLPAGFKISWHFDPLAHAEPEVECYWKPNPIPYEDIPARLREVVDVRLPYSGSNHLLLGDGIGSAALAQAFEDLGVVERSRALTEFSGGEGGGAESAGDRFVEALGRRLRLPVSPLAAVRDPGDVLRLVAVMDEPLGDPLVIDLWSRYGAAAVIAATVLSGGCDAPARRCRGSAPRGRRRGWSPRKCR